MALLSIGEVASQVDLQPSAIRYYEGLGLLAPPQRVGGKRRYGAEAVLRLKAINLFKRAGFSISEMRVLLASDPWPDPARIAALTAIKLQELDALIGQVKVMQAVLESVRRCGCLAPEGCALLADI